MAVVFRENSVASTRGARHDAPDTPLLLATESLSVRSQTGGSSVLTYISGTIKIITTTIRCVAVEISSSVVPPWGGPRWPVPNNSNIALSFLWTRIPTRLRFASSADVVLHIKKPLQGALRFERIAATATHPTDNATRTRTRMSPIGMYFSLKKLAVLEPALRTSPPQYEEPSRGAAEKTRIDQRIQQLLTRAWLQVPESLSLVERETQSGHFEKFSLHPANKTIVDRIVRRRCGRACNRACPRWRIACRKGIAEHLIDVRRVPLLPPGRVRRTRVPGAVGPPFAIWWRTHFVGGVDRHAASRSSESTHLATSNGIGDADPPRSAFLTSSVTMVSSEAAAAAYPTSSTLPVPSASATTSANPSTTIRLFTCSPFHSCQSQGSIRGETQREHSISRELPVNCAHIHQHAARATIQHVMRFTCERS